MQSHPPIRKDFPSLKKKGCSEELTAFYGQSKHQSKIQLTGSLKFSSVQGHIDTIRPHRADRQVPLYPALQGGKGHKINETTLPGSPAL